MSENLNELQGNVTDDSLEITCMICADLVVNAHKTRCCQRLFCLKCIQKWLNRGNSYNTTNSCPNCRAHISESDLIFDEVVDEISAAKLRSCPNKEIFSCQFKGNRKQIDDHKEECLTNYQMSSLSGAFDLLRSGTDAEKAESAMKINESLKVNPNLAKYIIQQDGINLLISLLQSENEEESPYWAIMCFDLLAMDETTKQLCIEAGIAQPLLHLVATATDYILPNSMMLVSKFVISNRANQELFSSAGVAPLLVRHLQSNSAEVQTNAAGAIWNFVSKNRKNQIEVASLGAFPPLIALLLTGNNVINAAGALWNIIASSDPVANCIVTDFEVVTHLVTAMREENAECREWIVGSFETLCSSNAGNIAVVAAAGATPQLAACIRVHGSNILTHLSVAVLLRIMQHSVQYRSELDEQEVLAALLRILQNPFPVPAGVDAIEGNVMRLLRIFCDNHEEHQAYIVRNGGIASLLGVLAQCSSDDPREEPAVDLLAHISAMTPAAALAIAETNASLPSLLRVLASSASNADTKKKAVDTVYAAFRASPHTVCSTLLESTSGITVLVELIRPEVDSSENIPEEVMASVAQLLRALCSGNGECRRTMQAAGVTTSSSFGYTGEGAW